jgi:ABC-type transport system involved in multi-copper enzyme maturation permease subunit
VPIHDQGYRRYGGERGQRRGWWVITSTTIRAQIRRRRVIALLLVAWLPFLVRAVLLYAAANFQQASFLAATPQVFREFLGWQSIFVFFVTILIGAPLIADDRQTNALQIYLSKPLTRFEYVVGKLAVLAAFLTFVTWLPAMVLLFLQTMFSGSTQFLRDNLYLVPAITLFCLLQVLVSALTVLALSSLSKSRRFVSILYAAIILFSQAIQQALVRTTGSRTWALISPGETLDVIGDRVFRVATTTATVPVGAAIAVIVALVVTSIVVLERRVRGVEVVT